MSKRLALVFCIVLMASLVTAQSITNYARNSWNDWQRAVLSTDIVQRASMSGFLYNGKMFPRILAESVKVGQAQALKCTLDFKRPVFAPFVYASAATVTAKVMVFDDYDQTSAREVSMGTDTLAFGIASFARRFVFTVAAADTPCAFYVWAYPVP